MLTFKTLHPRKKPSLPVPPCGLIENMGIQVYLGRSLSGPTSTPTLLSLRGHGSCPHGVGPSVHQISLTVQLSAGNQWQSGRALLVGMTISIQSKHKVNRSSLGKRVQKYASHSRHYDNIVAQRISIQD